MSLSVLLAVAFVGAALYYVCPLRFRWVLLLLLSYGFYLPAACPRCLSS